MSDFPSQSRYDSMTYRRCGNSGIQLPLLSLGLWHNFGGIDVFENGRAIVRTAFDHGITHLDLANNYGPPYGSAEETLGRILQFDLMPYRDELIISTKAGFDMWPGPYGNFGSRKYLVASLDQSLKRLGVDYVDIFYHHRPDPDTPLAETMGALDFAVRSGRALYVGISNYPPDKTREAAHILRDLGTPCLIHQPKYNLLTRQPENNGLFDTLLEEGIGCIAFSILNGGMLTDKYLDGIPQTLAPLARVTRSKIASTKNSSAKSASSTTTPAPEARPSPRWPSPGSSARRRSLPHFAEPAAPNKSKTASVCSTT